MQNRLVNYLLPWLRLFLFVLCLFLVLLPTQLLLQWRFLHSVLKQIDSVYKEGLQEFGLAAVVITALGLLFSLLPQFSFHEVFVAKRKAFSGWAKGLLLGLAMMGLCALALWALGYVKFVSVVFQPRLLLGYFILFLGVAIFEELLFRSFPLVVFAEYYPIVFTMLINGTLFACAHLGNPGVTPLALVNVGLAGCLFCLGIVHHWQLTWSIGLHFGWNFAQGCLLGYKVSGLDAGGFVKAIPLGHIFMSGGSFGIEGSLICTIVLLIAIALLFWRFKIHPLATIEPREMLIQEIEDELN